MGSFEGKAGGSVGRTRVVQFKMSYKRPKKTQQKQINYKLFNTDYIIYNKISLGTYKLISQEIHKAYCNKLNK